MWISTGIVEKGHSIGTRRAKGGLQLHKFIPNNEVILESIPSSERATDAKKKGFDFLKHTARVRSRNPLEHESFRFSNTLANQPGKHRCILATVASIYDPFGFLASYVLTRKKILQEMCHQGVGWDD